MLQLKKGCGTFAKIDFTVLMKSLILPFLLLSLFAIGQVPVEGDELIKIIGMRKGAGKVGELEKYLNDDIQGKGFSLTFDNNVLIRIDFYNKNNPYFSDLSPFSGKLPKGLSFENTVFKTKSIIGEGFKEDGEPANVLTLSKQFPLTDMDAVNISIEFRKGKMSMLALIMEKGGAEKAEDADKAKEGGIVIRGDDYFFMVKKNIYNKEVENFISTLGYYDYSDRSILMYIQKGVTIQLNQAKQIRKITFYSGGQPSSKNPPSFLPFEGKMPYNLKFSDTPELVLQKAGTPKINTGGKMIFQDAMADVEILFANGKVYQVSIGLPEKNN